MIVNSWYNRVYNLYQLVDDEVYTLKFNLITGKFITSCVRSTQFPEKQKIFQGNEIKFIPMPLNKNP